MTLPIRDTNFDIDDVYLHKFSASEKIKEVIDFLDDSEKPMTKTASCVLYGGKVYSEQKDIVRLFTGMLDHLNLHYTNEDDVINNFAAREESYGRDSGALRTSRTHRNSERKNDIKIVSKTIKDSHYQVDVSKDLIKHKGRRVHMVSCYVRDAYLGRYLIKRNYFYTADREAAADDAYDEINTKMNALKERYYEEVLDVSGIFSQAKQILDGVVSEVDFAEDSLGSTVSR